MKSVRANFNKAAKEEMWARAKGKCEICHLPFAGRRPHYHHWPVPAALMDRKATAKDGKCICKPCHDIETKRETVPLVSKAKRIEAKRNGTKAESRSTFQKAVKPIQPDKEAGGKGHDAWRQRMRDKGKMA